MSGQPPPQKDVDPKMSLADAARIQSATAKAHGGVVESGSFAARAQSAAAHNAAAALEQQQQQQQGRGQGGGQQKS